MKLQRNKTLSTIALILILTVSAFIASMPAVNAHTPPWTVPTSAYCIAVPNTIGLGQYTTIVVWTDRYPGTAGGGIGQRWDGFTIEITKPDGTKETIGPFKASSDVGSDARQYVPTQLGTYTIVFSWPGETVVSSPASLTSVDIGDYYQGSTSAPATFVVKQAPIAEWQEPPLPTGYWTLPINDANRGWSTLASNWLKGSWLVNNFQMWGQAPESPHIVWTKPITPAIAGGIIDAQWPGIPANVEDYEEPWATPIIMNGKIYYNAPPVSDSSKYGYYCIDLYTGQQIWYKNGTDNGLNNPFTTAGSYTLSQSYLGLTQGQLYHYYSVNGQGILSYLIMVSGSTWYFLDAATGNFLLKLINVPGGTTATDQDGSILKYSYNPTTGNLLCWNSSQSIPPLSPVGTSQQQWKMRFGATIDAVNDTTWTNVGPSGSVTANEILPRSGYTMNVTIEKNLPVSVAFGVEVAGVSSVLQDHNRVPKELFGFYKGTGSTIGSPVDPDTFSAWVVGINEHATDYSPFPGLTATQQNNLGFTATLLWNKNITVPLPGKNYTWNLVGVSYDDQVFWLRCSQTIQMWGYSLKTGQLLWGPTAPESTMNFYGISGAAYYGKILTTGLAGTLNAYDPQTGKLLWTYAAKSVGRESPYGENQPLSISAVCDGKVYTYTSEHSPTKPLWRGAYIRCINITDGTEIWKLLNFAHAYVGYAIADGYIVTSSDYDNLIYCIGKGPTATTVTATPKVMTSGSSVLIEGTVTDQSPGAKDTPAIADASMEAWMEYLYEDQAQPTNATGVPVTLTAIDPNGNTQNIGTVISDTLGTYAVAWKPPVPGLYTVLANFAGSKSYGGSLADTHFVVAAAVAAAPASPQASATPTAAPTQTITPSPVVTATPVPAPSSSGVPMTYIIIAVVAVIVVVAAAALALRRRK